MVGHGDFEIVGSITVLKSNVGIPGDGSVYCVDFNLMRLDYLPRKKRIFTVADIHLARFVRPYRKLAVNYDVIIVHLQVEQLICRPVSGKNNIIFKHDWLVNIVVYSAFKLRGGAYIRRRLAVGVADKHCAGYDTGNYQYRADYNAD